MSVSKMSVDQMSVDQMSVDQMSVDQMSVSQIGFGPKTNLAFLSLRVDELFDPGPIFVKDKVFKED
jgi:hypothetical protein